MLSSSSSSVLTGATSRRATKMVPKTLNALAGRRTVAAARTRTTTATTTTTTCNANNGRLQSSVQQQQRRRQQQHHQQQQQQKVQQQSSLAAVYAVPASIEVTAGTAAAVGKRITLPPRTSKRASIATAINSAINPSTASASAAASKLAAVCRRSPTKQCHKNTLSWDQARSLFLSAAVPMVGFGFMDQFIMVSAGSYIDNTLGVQLGLATMSAAACGQVISDSCGVLMGGTLERLLLIAPAKLSTAQQALPAVRRIKLLGGVLGVIAGCIIGAIPLILSSSREEEEEHHRQRHEGYEKQQRIGSFLNNVMASPDERWSQHAARCTLHVRRNGEKQVWPSSSASSFATGAATVVIAASSLRGESSDSTTDPVQQCMDSADAFIVYDRKLYVPVVSSNSNNNNSQEVIAVLQIESSSSNGHDFYSPADIDDAKQLARHIGYQL
mmetsp:Transcript_57130/g.139274  ORF Transcript_57130/g.139274 Transcript_57130/m.139274 type:complete len:442 (-) Transcript_57130:97-1422(-)